MKKFITLTIITIAIVLSGCDMDSFLFNNQKIAQYTFPNNNIPDSLIEKVTLKSESYTLYGFWIKSNGDYPGRTILYCEGNKHSIDNYWDRVMVMHKMGFNVFIFDYRGYGMSEGESSEDGMHKDAEAALDYVLNVRKVSKDSLCIYGFSLGNVASIYLASSRVNPASLIAEAPFASANSLTQGSIGLDIPELWLTKGSFNNAELVKKINTHFLVIGSKGDDFVRFDDNAKVVYENAPMPKKLELLTNAPHPDFVVSMGEDAYIKLIKDWILFNK